MKIFKTVFFAAITFVVISCTSNDNSSNSNPGTSGFTWRENDPNSTTVKTAFLPTFSMQYKTLIAKDQAGATLFEINLSGATVGAYNIDNSANVITYTGENPYFIATSGTLNITANANSKISGNFEAFRAGAAGTVTRIYATFVDVTVIP